VAKSKRVAATIADYLEGRDRWALLEAYKQLPEERAQIMAAMVAYWRRHG
jgi:hypothetical protein